MYPDNKDSRTMSFNDATKPETVRNWRISCCESIIPSYRPASCAPTRCLTSFCARNRHIKFEVKNRYMRIRQRHNRVEFGTNTLCGILSCLGEDRIFSDLAYGSFRVLIRREPRLKQLASYEFAVRIERSECQAPRFCDDETYVKPRDMNDPHRCLSAILDGSTGPTRQHRDSSISKDIKECRGRRATVGPATFFPRNTGNFIA